VTSEQWDAARVGEHIEATPSTVRSYASRGQMPPPDGRIGNTPWWWSDTITKWHASRRGQGWRGSRA